MSTTVHQEIVLPVSPARVFAALINSAEHSQFTGGGPAEISREPGGAWSAFGGKISGRTLEVVENKRIVQAWRSGGWAEGIYSIVRFELNAEGSGTRLVLDHTGIPDGEVGHLEGGWHKMYWEPMKKHFG